MHVEKVLFSNEFLHDIVKRSRSIQTLCWMSINFLLIVMRANIWVGVVYHTQNIVAILYRKVHDKKSDNNIMKS